MKTKFLAPIIIASMATALTGCVSADHVGAFSQAASQAATQVANGFEQVQETTILRRISDVASGTDSPTDATFAGLLDDKQLRPRLDCLAELQKYAASLGQLAGADFRKDIDTASANLYSALDGLANTYQKATTSTLPGAADDLAIVTTAVEAIGNSLAEYKRQKALRSIILQTDPAIQTVCADMERTFNGFAGDKFIFENLNSVVADMTGDYNIHKSHWDYTQKKDCLERIRQAQRVRDGAGTFMMAAAQSAAALGKAHKALAEAASQHKLTSAAVVRAISELSSQANKAKQFYDQIHPQK